MMDIYPELALLADTKETLRLTLGLRKDVPFSQYASHIPYYLKAGTVFDFANNQYSKDQLPVDLSDTSEFIRLSVATMWEDGQLVEVADNLPRISGEGLLIEPQSTNLAASLERWSVRQGNTKGELEGGWLAVNTIEGNDGLVYTYPPYPLNILNSFSISVVTPREETVKITASGIYTRDITPNIPTRLSTEFSRTSRTHVGIYLNEGDTQIGFPQVEVGVETSYIPTGNSATTRAPDILNIQRLPTQTITGDWDADVTYTVSGSVATFAGYGYIRNIVVVGDPISPFKGGEKGFWIDPSDTSTLFQDSDGTIPVVDGDPIGLVLDRSGNNYHLTQTVSASRPELLDGGVVFDRVDDALTLNVPEGGITGTLFLATTRGTASYGVSMPAGVWELGNRYSPVGDVVSAVLVDRALTEDEKARLHAYGVGKGGTEFGVETTFSSTFRAWSHLVDFPLIDTSSVGEFYMAWRHCSGLTSFPVLDVSSGTNFQTAWQGCTRLTSFPVLDVSSGTNFQHSWQSCTSLTTFPANFFDNCLATNFNFTFSSTNLSQASIDGILVSINSNSTSDGTFSQSGGSAPSTVGQAAIDAMRSRGWTVTTTGGY